MAHSWYIIHTLSGQEQKVLDSINKRVDVEEMGAHIEEVFVAKEKVVDVRGGEKKVSMKMLLKTLQNFLYLKSMIQSNT